MKSVIEICEAGRDYWDKSVASLPIVHPLNAFGWGSVRKADGWQATYLIAKNKETVTGAALLLTKKIPLVGLSIMYLPRGPIFDLSDGETLKALLKRIQRLAKERHAIFLRLDPNIAEASLGHRTDPFVENRFIHLNHRWSYWNAPRDVYRIDLTKSASVEALFMSISSKARTKVRKARKLGVSVREAVSLDELNQFYLAFMKFTIQKGFMARKLAYQKKLWDEYIDRGYGKLFLAIFDGEIIGGSLCLSFGKKCLAMHMGTPFEFRRLNANDLLEWESIKWSKEQECQWFCFRGVGSSEKEKTFKKKFKPEEVRLVGYYDLPFIIILHKLLLFCEFKVLPLAVNSAMGLRSMYKQVLRPLRKG